MALRTTLCLLASTLLRSILAANSAGCGKDLPKAQQPPGGESHQTSFTQSDGTGRTYLIHIPSNYDKNTAVPLIFSFHGRTKDSAEQEELSQFSNEAFNPNGIAVYPQGIENQWQGDPASSNVDDIGFIADMISHLSDRYCIDTSRIYATGKSNGGGFTNILACDPKLSTQIAAFAPVSGAFYVSGSTESDCNPQTITITCNPGRKPLPILEFHGGKDTTIPYSGGPRRGECLPTIPHWVREWSKREGYGLRNKTTSLYSGNVLKYEYGGDAGELGIVTHYLTSELGHAWPSTSPNGDNEAGSYFNATPVIMDFFGKYTL
ncbi:probable poly(3-hydroxybutyrate) depolymerase [Phialocephala subalpina]|uniref:feruloyl esterase n=1 Tax=Phialocephala subalpina TaxID=576137 RepID=A0A1L7XKP8_9HELO|nr:probable poly(3-hydroxybutyrate) depolymerase [Phialocephala subalpina]